ncbi:MAG: hypothetical protein EBR82_45080 [Caulobacteraceae bacterium]|nr:hypothetical protein [Caulobacteraceae bacterium]
MASRYQDEAGDMGAEQWRDFIRTKFEENGGVIPQAMGWSEDPKYYQAAFNVSPEEAATMAENGRYQNQQIAQNELEQNKKWRRKDEEAAQAQRGIAEAAPEVKAGIVPTGGVAPSSAIEGRGVPLPAPAPTEVAAKPKPPQLPPNPKFAPLPEPQTYAVLREAREERAKAPRDRARGLEPKKIIGRTAREVLRYASRLNQPAVVGPSDKGFTIYDIAALLAEVNSPLLDKEKVESLGSLGSRGRAARFSYAAAIGVPSTRTTSVETLVHEVAHTLTNDAIFKYSQRTRGKSGKAYIDSLKNAIADKNTPEPVVKLFNLYISTLEQLGIMDAYGKAGGLAGTMHPDMSRKRAIKMQKSGKLRTDLGWSELYGLANVDEFVAQTFSSEKFRNLLKTLQAPTENKSVWESFVSAIRYLLNLPNDTMASAVIETSISIAETVPEIERQKVISLTQDELDGLNDGLELKLYLENNPSKSIGDAKDDFRKRFNRDPHQFASQHAKFFTKEEIEKEIRGFRDRLLEYQQPTPSPAPEVRESRREPAPLTQQDREYLDAVERGDLDAASRVVEQAAKVAGFTQKWYHGTAAKAFNVFRDFGRGFIYFTQDRGDAMGWAENSVEYSRPEYAKGEKPIPRVVEAYIKPEYF